MLELYKADSPDDDDDVRGKMLCSSGIFSSITIKMHEILENFIHSWYKISNYGIKMLFRTCKGTNMRSRGGGWKIVDLKINNEGCIEGVAVAAARYSTTERSGAEHRAHTAEQSMAHIDERNVLLDPLRHKNRWKCVPLWFVRSPNEHVRVLFVCSSVSWTV